MSAAPIGKQELIINLVAQGEFPPSWDYPEQWHALLKAYPIMHRFGEWKMVGIGGCVCCPCSNRCGIEYTGTDARGRTLTIFVPDPCSRKNGAA